MYLWLDSKFLSFDPILWFFHFSQVLPRNAQINLSNMTFFHCSAFPMSWLKQTNILTSKHISFSHFWRSPRTAEQIPLDLSNCRKCGFVYNLVLIFQKPRNQAFYIYFPFQFIWPMSLIHSRRFPFTTLASLVSYLRYVHREVQQDQASYLYITVKLSSV